MSQNSKIEAIIREALEQCPAPNDGEIITVELVISEIRLSVSRHKPQVEPNTTPPPF